MSKKYEGLAQQIIEKLGEKQMSSTCTIVRLVCALS